MMLPRRKAKQLGQATDDDTPRTKHSQKNRLGMRMLMAGFVLGLAVPTIFSSTRQKTDTVATTSNDFDMAVSGVYQKLRKCDCDKNPLSESRTSAKQKLKTNQPIVSETAKIDTASWSQNSTVPRSSDVEAALDNGSNQANILHANLRTLPKVLLTQDGTDILDFDPDVPAVIVAKIQGRKTFGQLNQSLCLLTAAYNNKVNYDVVIFSATPISENELKWLRVTVAPANLTYVIDNPGIKEMVDQIPKGRKEDLLKRCNATSSSDITWDHMCSETSSSGTTRMPIKYNWQAEFRTLHIWKHPVMAKYKYMLWMDGDSFCTKSWKYDPIAVMRRNDMVLLFDNFPAGVAKGSEWPPIFQKAFGSVICKIERVDSGHLRAFGGNCLGKPMEVKQIHGFFHVTNLDFYRSDPVTKWFQAMIPNKYTFSRKYDDQIAVTVPAAVLAGNRSWDMRSIGMNMSVVHNFILDGKRNEQIGGYLKFWKTRAETIFPEAYGVCKAVSPG